MRLNIEPHPLDICVCGDYREDHEDGWCAVCLELRRQGRQVGRPACMTFVLEKRAR